jgi:hypothetical protein
MSINRNENLPKNELAVTPNNADRSLHHFPQMKLMPQIYGW